MGTWRETKDNEGGVRGGRFKLKRISCDERAPDL